MEKFTSNFNLKKMANKKETEGKPLFIEIELIDEDPDQPRKEDNPAFSEESIAELAQSIIARGVKTPISVHRNKNNPKRFIINHGARRFRASIKAGRKTIPVFIDEDYSEVDQVVENLQRDSLTPREIYQFIEKQLNKGMTQKELAQKIGKSTSWVSNYGSIIKMDETLKDALETGKINNPNLLSSISRYIKKEGNKDEILSWVKDADVLTEKSFAEFKDRHKEKVTKKKISKANIVLLGIYNNRNIRITSRKTKNPENAYISYIDEKAELEEVPLKDIKLIKWES